VIGYALLLADLVLVALLLTIGGYLLVALVRAPFRRRPKSAGADDGRTWRRCESCKRRWQGTPGQDLGAATLRLRRAVRRRARKRQRTVEWARAEGWSRCPSCLSTKVRDSRRQSAR